jgi:hypothetical protein
MAKPAWGTSLRTGVSPSFLIGKGAEMHAASKLERAGPLCWAGTILCNQSRFLRKYWSERLRLGECSANCMARHMDVKADIERIY